MRFSNDVTSAFVVGPAGSGSSICAMVRPSLLPPNDWAELRRPPAATSPRAKTFMAAPVSFSRLILIMVSLGMGRGLSQGYTGSRSRPWPKVGAEVCTFRPRRAQAPGPIPKETVMRFYNQAHAFYCGVDLHARTMYLCVVDQAGNIVLHSDL